MRLLLALLPLLMAAQANALAVSAEVNKVTAEMREQIVLAVTVAGPQASLPKPKLPPAEASALSL